MNKFKGKVVLGGKGCAVKIYRNGQILGVVDIEMKVLKGDIIKCGYKWVKVI
jgi:hypothetical protein